MALLKFVETKQALLLSLSCLYLYVEAIRPQSPFAPHSGFALSRSSDQSML